MNSFASTFFTFLKKVYLRIRFIWHVRLTLLRSLRYSSYSIDSYSYFFDSVDSAGFKQYHFASLPVAVISAFLSNKYQIFGSSWTDLSNTRSSYLDQTLFFRLYYYLTPNHSYQNYLRHIFPDDYRQIDWHSDFFSGRRWDSNSCSAVIPWVTNDSSDIKIPWELSRLSHLPQCLFSAYSLRSTNISSSNQLFDRTFYSIIDFIINNPPGYGVNWACAMDVSIRAANLALFIKLTTNLDFDLSQEKYTILFRSLDDHVNFISCNLEYSQHSNNHYLTNLCGLLISLCILPQSPKRDSLLLFCLYSLHVEVDRQFLTDGGNFEGSTGYHRYTTEMVFYTFIFLSNLPSSRLIGVANSNLNNLNLYSLYEPSILPDYESLTLFKSSIFNNGSPFSERFVARLYRAIDFTKNILINDIYIPLIGDFDSGKFFKLDSLYSAENNIRDFSSSTDPNQPSSMYEIDIASLESYSIYCYINGIQHTSNTFTLLQLFAHGSNNTLTNIPHLFRLLRPSSSILCNYPKIPLSSDVHLNNTPEIVLRSFTLNLTERLQTYFYHSFGLFIWKSNGFYLSIRCLKSIPKCNTHHFHDDQLSVQLIIDNQPIFLDPGSKTYTSNYYDRNLYRSFQAHHPFYALSDNICYYPPFKPLLLHPASIQSLASDNFCASVISEFKSFDISVTITNNNLIICRSYSSSTSSPLEESLPLSVSTGYRRS